jgi:hypothetical protein
VGPVTQRVQFAAPLLGAFFLVACTAQPFNEPLCRAPDQSLESQRGTGIADNYFPAQFAKPSEDCGYPVGPVPIVSKFERDWFAGEWRAASESSFYEAAQCKTVPEFALRFSYIPSFDRPMFIRVQSDRNGLSLIAKELSGDGGYDPGTLARSKKIRLTDKQASELKEMLISESLFEEPPATCEQGFDGSEWIFEMVDKDEYRMVKRWSPASGPAHDLGQLLIRLSGWGVETD